MTDDRGTVRWFGPSSWGAPICDTLTQVVTPAGVRCTHCRERIGALDRGVLILGQPSWVYHLLCWLEQVVGREMADELMSTMADEGRA